MDQRAPEHQFGKPGVADLVGVGEVVARGGMRKAAMARALSRRRHCGSGMGELHEAHRPEMAEHGVGAGFEIDPRFLG